MLRQVDFENLPAHIQQQLLATNCEFAIYDELWFFQDGDDFWLENHVFPEARMASHWNGSDWTRVNWDEWKLRQPMLDPHPLSWEEHFGEPPPE